MTDVGIKGLCLSMDNLGKEDKTVGLCKFIEKLVLRDTSVTKVGTRVALKNLSNLKVLECDSLLAIDVLMADMHQEVFEHKITSYSVTKLDVGPLWRKSDRDVLILVFDPQYRIGYLRQAVVLYLL